MRLYQVTLDVNFTQMVFRFTNRVHACDFMETALDTHVPIEDEKNRPFTVRMKILEVNNGEEDV